MADDLTAQVLREMAEEAKIAFAPKEAPVDPAAEVPDIAVDEMGTISMTWRDGQTQVQVMLGDLSIDKRQLGCMFSARINKTGNKKDWRWLADPIRINLLSHTAKENMRKQLEARSQLDWTWRMAQITINAKSQLTLLSQSVELNKVQLPATDIDWLMYPLLERNKHTVWAAEGGTGKSMLSLAAAVSVGLGRTLIPGTSVKHESSVKSLILDWEDDAGQHALRMKQLCAGKGWSMVPNTIRHIKMSAPITEVTYDIRREIQQYGIGLVIIDSTGVALNGDINDAAAALDYMRAVRALGNVTVLSLTHLAKENRGTPIGSVYFREGPRAMWLAISEQEASSKESMVGLFHKKHNNTGKQPPIGLRVEFSLDAVRYYQQGLSSFAKAGDHLSVIERLVLLLDNGQMSLSAIEKRLADIKPVEITKALNQLYLAGKITRIGEDIGLADETTGGVT